MKYESNRLLNLHKRLLDRLYLLLFAISHHELFRHKIWITKIQL